MSIALRWVYIMAKKANIKGSQNVGIQNVGIQDSWSLVAFARSHGRMKIAPFVNSETGEAFKSCAFVDEENNVTLVAFSSKMGELTPAEIRAQKNDLQVVMLASGTYKLCKRGENNWEDVDLF